METILKKYFFKDNNIWFFTLDYIGIILSDNIYELLPMKTPEQWLKSKLPEGYINKWVFRVVIGLMVVTYIWFLYQNDFDLKTHMNIKCPEGQRCYNNYYICKHSENDVVKSMNNCDDKISKLACQEGLCDTEYLEPGQTLGKTPPDTGLIYTLFIIYFVMGLLINHIMLIFPLR